jgi:hypothetical protein
MTNSKKPEHQKGYDKISKKLRKEREDKKQAKYEQTYKANYQKYKDKIKEKRQAKIKRWTCECGKQMNSENKESHLLTNVHKSIMESLKPLENVKVIDLPEINVEEPEININPQNDQHVLNPELTETSDIVKT